VCSGNVEREDAVVCEICRKKIGNGAEVELSQWSIDAIFVVTHTFHRAPKHKSVSSLRPSYVVAPLDRSVSENIGPRGAHAPREVGQTGHCDDPRRESRHKA